MPKPQGRYFGHFSNYLWGQDEHVVRRNRIKGIFLRAAFKIGRYTARLLASRNGRWVSVWGNVPKTLHQKHRGKCYARLSLTSMMYCTPEKENIFRLQEEVNYPTAKGIIRLEHPRRLRWTLRVCLVRYGSLYTTQHVLWFAFIKEVKTLHKTKQQQHAFISLWTYYHVTECRHSQKVREREKVVGYGLCFMIIDDGLYLH